MVVTRRIGGVGGLCSCCVVRRMPRPHPCARVAGPYDGSMPRPGAAPSSHPPHVPGIDVVEARRRLQGEPRTYVLDVREPWEYLAGHLPGAALVPLGELERRVGEVPRDRPVLAVCQSGSRSWTAAALLLAAGYPEGTNGEGGTAAWIGKGDPTQPETPGRSRG